MSGTVIDIKDAIINFHGIVKNRLGPYEIILKNDDADYLSAARRWRSKSESYNYWPYGMTDLLRDVNAHSMDFAKIILSTRTDEIQLSKKDLNPECFREPK